MNIKPKSSALVLLLWMSCWDQAYPLNPDDPVELYCGIVYALAGTLGSARDKGVSREKAESGTLKLKVVQNDPQLQKDVREIANFVYNVAPSTSTEKLANFVRDDWCLAQMKKR